MNRKEIIALFEYIDYAINAKLQAERTGCPLSQGFMSFKDEIMKTLLAEEEEKKEQEANVVNAIELGIYICAYCNTTYKTDKPTTLSGACICRACEMKYKEDELELPRHIPKHSVADDALDAAAFRVHGNIEVKLDNPETLEAIRNSEADGLLNKPDVIRTIQNSICPMCTNHIQLTESITHNDKGQVVHTGCLKAAEEFNKVISASSSTSSSGKPVCNYCNKPVEDLTKSLINSDGSHIHYECHLNREDD